MNKAKKRRQTRVRERIKSLRQGRKLTVCRSNQHIEAQVVDLLLGKTLVGYNDMKLSEKNQKKNKTEKAFLVGKEIAELAVKKGIKKVVFDRGSYRYHGRVKSLAEGARAGGLKF